ncbi:MAG TPA: GGDEF domain-containing protein [Noviherbaspirillum sp.]|nr:GGDEF domain-containing protein [Noviherbaspirillum sp.]
MDIPVTATQSKILPHNLGSEMGHACFRLGLTLMFVAYLLFAHLFGHIGDLRNAAVGIAAYFAFGLVWLGVVGLSLLTYRSRRMISIVLDQVVFAFALYQAGDVLAPTLWAPVLMAIGNGLRNGLPYARLSSLIGGLSVGAALSLSPYWQAGKLVTEGIVLSIVILPWYTLMLSEQIAQAKREMQLRAARFESASRTDSLTGLMNRAGFFQCLQKLLEDVARNGTRSAVMLLDLDGFKGINDTCGHNTGDEVLKCVANRLHDGVDAADKAARLGGDEFGILITDASDLQEVQRVAQSLIDSIAAVHVHGQGDLRIGASIGICLLPEDDCRDETAVMETADRRMYHAKKSGKNQYCIDSP